MNILKPFLTLALIKQHPFRYMIILYCLYAGGMFTLAAVLEALGSPLDVPLTRIALFSLLAAGFPAVSGISQARKLSDEDRTTLP